MADREEKLWSAARYLLRLEQGEARWQAFWLRSQLVWARRVSGSDQQVLGCFSIPSPIHSADRRALVAAWGKAGGGALSPYFVSADGGVAVRPQAHARHRVRFPAEPPPEASSARAARKALSGSHGLALRGERRGLLPVSRFASRRPAVSIEHIMAATAQLLGFFKEYCACPHAICLCPSAGGGGCGAVWLGE